MTDFISALTNNPVSEVFMILAALCVVWQIWIFAMALALAAGGARRVQYGLGPAVFATVFLIISLVA